MKISVFDSNGFETLLEPVDAMEAVKSGSYSTKGVKPTPQDTSQPIGISIDGSSSVYGNIYQSGIILDGGMYQSEVGILIADTGSFYDGESGLRLAPELDTDGMIALAVGDLIIGGTLEPNPSDVDIKSFFTNTPTFLDYYWYKEGVDYSGGNKPDDKTLVGNDRQFIPTEIGVFWVEIYARNDYGVSIGFCKRTNGHFTVTAE